MGGRRVPPTLLAMVFVSLIPLVWLVAAAGVVAVGEAMRRDSQGPAAAPEDATDWCPRDEEADLDALVWLVRPWPPVRSNCEARTRRCHADLRRTTPHGGTRLRTVSAGRCHRAKCTCMWARRVG